MFLRTLYKYLSEFTQLTCLSVYLTSGNLPSFASALAHLPQLKAVGAVNATTIYYPETAKEQPYPMTEDYDKVLWALGSWCKKLEHLVYGSTPLIEALLEHLVSLEITINSRAKGPHSH